ncbi:hypothetical protein JCM17846_17780 [Iodidimonas nitroreducens]|uniref:Phosphoenolpyruvate carboxylase n=1 Tax=Iodidimonas nitroreducens TaxID=1236968 RepID=A0A5A7NAV9_9PROT|nr:phosphoenolpyruvate carboxylase [Iodidimonas nitroreducens]GAK33314.1 phosphoenolpyruvate carboxylase [alpha proteobacterium Q-1]GER04096.1 hypothetical protein JCM17846_17780 [Iodidimonas nitroreducens]
MTPSQHPDKTGADSPLIDSRDLEARLLARLEDLRLRRKEDPGFNPIWRLACDLSTRIESGRLDREDLSRLCGHLLDRSLKDRAGWMQAMLEPLQSEDNEQRLRAIFEDDAQNLEFDEFAERWGRAAFGCVFTAHPTFLLSPSQSEKLIHALTGVHRKGTDEGDHKAPTLSDEHQQVLAAIATARAAHSTFCRLLYEVAKAHYGKRWLDLRPRPFDLASWVGYDMDGRTDIGWADCVRLRLMEKESQLGWYLADIDQMPLAACGEAITTEMDAIKAVLETALGHSRRAIALFSEPLDQAPAFTAAANWLTDPGPGRLISLRPVIERLHALAAAHPDDAISLPLMILAARMECYGLGAGRVHFRMNATQLHNAVRRRLDRDKPVDLASRGALIALNDLYENEAPLAVNFAALSMESTTAVRQFLTIAQFIKHIDADSDIRLLIAECERPSTVLAAVYLARLFGVDHHVDISPLFETPPALEGGERFLDVLFSQPAYRKAVKARGRISIQTGFSDAGRFIGQIPASLSIERLQANMARLVESHGLGDLECLIFNTHGESMGRGAHPASFAARLDHVLSPWARKRFEERGLRLRHETSFQGGDGYLWFKSTDLALAVFTRIFEYRKGLDQRVSEADEDSFYKAPDITLDFFRRVMRFQESLMGSGAYHRTLSAFGLALLKTTGSRKARRQFESGSGERPDLSKVRAIPHNAVLQQLGYPVNVLGGIGQATRKGREPFSEWRRESRRFSDLMDMVVASRTRASLRTMMAYGTLFDGGYWAARPHGADQGHLTEACLYIADRLERDDRFGAMLELSTRLRIDELLLHRLLHETGEDQQVLDAGERDFLALLHAVRIALIQHLFLLAAKIPQFSARNDISRADIMELVFELRIPEAVALLREAYPDTAPSADDFNLHEKSDYPDETAANYSDINHRLIDPIEIVYDGLLSISVAVANAFHAHG